MKKRVSRVLILALSISLCFSVLFSQNKKQNHKIIAETRDLLNYQDLKKIEVTIKNIDFDEKDAIVLKNRCKYFISLDDKKSLSDIQSENSVDLYCLYNVVYFYEEKDSHLVKNHKILFFIGMGLTMIWAFMI